MAAEDVRDIVIALGKQAGQIAALRTQAMFCARIGQFPRGTSRSAEEIAYETREERGVPTLWPYVPPPTVEAMAPREVLKYVLLALPEAPEGIAATLRAPLSPTIQAAARRHASLLELLIAGEHSLTGIPPFFAFLMAEVGRLALIDGRLGLSLNESRARRLLLQAWFRWHRTRPRPAGGYRAQANKLLGEGLPVDTVAKELGLSTSAVLRSRRRHGAPISRSAGAIHPSPSFRGDDSKFLRARAEERGVTPKRLIEEAIRGARRKPVHLERLLDAARTLRSPSSNALLPPPPAVDD
jgi:hypothetical protein